jgi:hypothetical protein
MRLFLLVLTDNVRFKTHAVYRQGYFEGIPVSNIRLCFFKN